MSAVPQAPSRKAREGAHPQLFHFNDSRNPRYTSRAGGPLEPDFGLSGAVLPLDKVFPPLVRLFVSSIPTRSRPVPLPSLLSRVAPFSL